MICFETRKCVPAKSSCWHETKHHSEQNGPLTLRAHGSKRWGKSRWDLFFISRGLEQEQHFDFIMLMHRRDGGEERKWISLLTLFSYLFFPSLKNILRLRTVVFSPRNRWDESFLAKVPAIDRRGWSWRHRVRTRSLWSATSCLLA